MRRSLHPDSAEYLAIISDLIVHLYRRIECLRCSNHSAQFEVRHLVDAYEFAMDGNAKLPVVERSPMLPFFATHLPKIRSNKNKNAVEQKNYRRERFGNQKTAVGCKAEQHCVDERE